MQNHQFFSNSYTSKMANQNKDRHFTKGVNMRLKNNLFAAVIFTTLNLVYFSPANATMVDQNIGAPPVAGYASWNNSGDSASIAGSGQNAISSYNENYFYQTVTGNFSISAVVTGTGLINGSIGQAGIMALSSLSGSGLTNDAYMEESGASSVCGGAYDPNIGGVSTCAQPSGFTNGSSSEYISLTRYNNTFSFEYTTGGSLVSLDIHPTLSLPSTLYIGLFANDTSGTALQNYSFTGIQGLTLPSGSGTTQQTSTGGSPSTTASAVPAPSDAMLFVLALIGLLLIKRKAPEQFA